MSLVKSELRICQNVRNLLILSPACTAAAFRNEQNVLCHVVDTKINAQNSIPNYLTACWLVGERAIIHPSSTSALSHLINMTVAALTRNPVDNAKPTTDALKIATDRILKQQALTLQTAAGYRLKLDEASSYVARLEQAYMKIVANNSGLKGKITTDQQTINKVTAQVDAQQLKMDDLTITVAQLQNELKNGMPISLLSSISPSN